MSEFHARIAWPENEVPSVAPDVAPGARHDPPAGLGAFDWRWRHAFARRRAHAALADEAGWVALPGTADAATRRRATALLRGCYVAIPAADRDRCVALAALAAAQAGIGVHVACVDDDGVTRLLAALTAASPAPAADGGRPLYGPLASDSMAALATSLASPRIVVGTVNAFALSWLRGNGARNALQRAAARLSGDDSFVFPYAPLLLLPDADRVLLEQIRQPLQLTASEPDVQTRFLRDVAQLVGSWQAGEHYTATPAQLLPPGDAVLAARAATAGGLWALPTHVRDEVMAAITARGLEADKHYRVDEAGLAWLVPAIAISLDPAVFARIERALTCMLGIEKTARARQKAWLPEYLLGYARIGAAGDDPGPEWRDIWWLAATPVIDGTRPSLPVRWASLADVLSDVQPAGSVLAFGQQAMQAALAPRLGDVPQDRQLCLERNDDRVRAAALAAAGTPLCVVGPVASARHVPGGISSIILLADPPPLSGEYPPGFARVAGWLAGRGSVGRRLADWLAVLALGRQAAHQRRLRMALVERMRQDRKTYAFTGRHGT